ncbi:MAG TPA: T9SS type A sorting domain-containing protein [Mucilaginibacter sp.]|nr:T9SS type A sorting domain-containing protein [Mucilaginibacter sp.]
MKTIFKKPGFEFIFSIALVMILGLPPILLAQIKTQQKDMDITIENGDTTINGKNIKGLAPGDREDALRDINNLRGAVHHRYFFKQIDTAQRIKHFEFRKMEPGHGRDTLITGNMIFKDSLGNVIFSRNEKMKGMKKHMAFNFRYNGEGRGDMRRPMRDFRWHERRNVQNFDYENVSSDGVTTHVSFHVSDPNDDELKRIPYVEGPKFQVTDLNIVPQFSSGKILLMFDLPSKVQAEVKLSDSNGNTLWSAKALNGTFSKSFALGLNGVYYLQVKQGKNISVKKIFKEE